MTLWAHRRLLKTRVKSPFPINHGMQSAHGDAHSAQIRSGSDFSKQSVHPPESGRPELPCAPSSTRAPRQTRRDSDHSAKNNPKNIPSEPAKKLKKIFPTRKTLKKRALEGLFHKGLWLRAYPGRKRKKPEGEAILRRTGYVRFSEARETVPCPGGERIHSSNPSIPPKGPSGRIGGF